MDARGSGGRGLHYTKDGSVLGVWHWMAVRTDWLQLLDGNHFGASPQISSAVSGWSVPITPNGPQLSQTIFHGSGYLTMFDTGVIGLLFPLIRILGMYSSGEGGDPG